MSTSFAACAAECEYCSHISKVALDESWCFEWLEELHEFYSYDTVLESHQQLQFSQTRMDKDVSDIRAKLGLLQRKTVR